jgi:hypothetical protein
VNTNLPGPGGYARRCSDRANVTNSGNVTVRRERSVLGVPAIRVARLRDLLLDADPVPGEFETVDPQGDQFGEPERRVRRDENEGLPPVGHRVHEPLEFIARERSRFVVFDLRQFDPCCGIRGYLSGPHRAPENRAQHLVDVPRAGRAPRGRDNILDVGRR